MKILLVILTLVINSCGGVNEERVDSIQEFQQDTITELKQDTTARLQQNTAPVAENKAVEIKPFSGSQEINTGSTTPQELLAYAQSLIGTPYKYGSTDPKEGFDCSGFITHVFNHFSISVPRSSIGFTNVKKEIPIDQAKPGDIILFTGTDSTIPEVGHMGIITQNTNNEVAFIHSSSGKAHGVTITPLNKYYLGRYVKTIRIFKQNDEG